MELTGQRGGDNMTDAVEEEELRDDEGLDQHHNASGDDGQERDDIQNADDVEDDVPRTSHGIAGAVGALEARHYGGFYWWRKETKGRFRNRSLGRGNAALQTKRR